MDEDHSIDEPGKDKRKSFHLLMNTESIIRQCITQICSLEHFLIAVGKSSDSEEEIHRLSDMLSHNSSNPGICKSYLNTILLTGLQTKDGWNKQMDENARLNYEIIKLQEENDSLRERLHKKSVKNNPFSIRHWLSSTWTTGNPTQCHTSVSAVQEHHHYGHSDSTYEFQRNRAGAYAGLTSEVTVQLVSDRQDPVTETALKQLMGKLSVTMETLNTTVKVNNPTNYGDVRNDQPLILVCMKTSRLGTNVDKSLRGLDTVDWSKMALIVLHHQEPHALPSTSSSSILTSSRYKEIGVILDMAFLTNEGFYTCDMNNSALNLLSSFLKHFEKK